MAKEDKTKMLEEIKDKFSRSKSAVLVDYRGINVSQATALRRRMREMGVEYRVLKNTLIRRSLQELGIEGLDKYLGGPTAVAFGYADPVLPAKAIIGFQKEFKLLEVKGGLVEGKAIEASEVKGLAELPPREVLIGKVMGGMKAPLYGFASVVQGPLRKFVYALAELQKKRAAEAV